MGVFGVGMLFLQVDAMAEETFSPTLSSKIDRGITFSRSEQMPVRAEGIVADDGVSGEEPCEGNNYLNNDYLDNVSMGGPMVGISFVPTSSVTIDRIEVFTGESTGPIALAIWSDDGGSPSKPLANLGNTNYVPINQTNAWQGADLLNPVTVQAGLKYWVVFDPNGGEQSPVTDNPAGVQQTYWGSYIGDVTGGASWFGPFSFQDRRWKFRMFCLPPLSLDHFKCYPVKGFQGEPIVVGLRDQFGAEKEVPVSVIPVALCNPVIKWHGGKEYPVNNPQQHLVCYQIKSSITGKEVVVSNQFGKQQKLTVGRSNLLCVPSSKTVVSDIQPKQP